MNPEPKKLLIALSWLCQLFASAVFFWAGIEKFMPDGGAVAMFTQLEMEPHGRYLIGMLEILAAVMLLWPRMVVFGAILSAGVMVGACIAHATVLGYAGEYGMMQLVALGVLACDVVILYIHRDHVPMLSRLVKHS